MIFNNWRLIVSGLSALALLALGASWWSRGAEIEKLKATQDMIVLAATQATVPPDKDGKRALLSPESVPAAIAALRATKDNAEAALAVIDAGAKADQASGARLDAALKRTLDAQDRTAASTQAKIGELSRRVTTGDRAQDCATMESDSLAPWQNWSN